ANAETCAAMTRAAVRALHLQLFADSPAAALTAIKTPDGMDSGAIIKAMKAKFGAVIANGQGEMKGQLFRVAHLGYFDYLDTLGVIGALEHVLAGLGVEVELGAGITAAQREYAHRLSNMSGKSGGALSAKLTS